MSEDAEVIAPVEGEATPELGGQEVDTTEDVARKSGWVDKDEWAEKGNDPGLPGRRASA